ncbi:hypothetical protein NDI76_06985 [Halogeometricum sp. S1BR25-6]|uniref:Type 4 fimbrial biogenesis protein PilX N-terminal domain-containing protein n=1 Tax=Halogeometricum salsisoli TaxID=2950536 RepID=A0ABU2GCE6_9EURY|nr:hypothetical protein [Halogeometricum sp. S1BR25-6]MDS0298481.1 hypothetical protein [Halogeometricum sp. S1BR25-6]
MADVSGDDRGQLVLVTALVMATLFVVLALLVNTTIYTGNVAARSDVSESATVINYRTEALDAAETTLRYVDRNENDTAGGVDAAYRRMNDSLRRGVGNWSDDAAAHDAFSGASTRTRVVDATNGTRIAQANASRNLSAPDGAANWTLANATGVRDLTFALDATSLATVSNGENESDLLDSGAFRANLTDSAGTRSVFVYERSDGDAGVTVRGTDGSLTTCGPVTGGTVTLDVEARTVDGAACPALSQFDEGGDPFDLSFDGADAAAGTYSVVVDREVDDAAVNQSLPLDSGAPFRTAALYDATVRVTYHGPDTYYEAETEVPDAGA